MGQKASVQDEVSCAAKNLGVYLEGPSHLYCFGSHQGHGGPGCATTVVLCLLIAQAYYFEFSLVCICLDPPWRNAIHVDRFVLIGGPPSQRASCVVSRPRARPDTHRPHPFADRGA